MDRTTLLQLARLEQKISQTTRLYDTLANQARNPYLKHHWRTFAEHYLTLSKELELYLNQNDRLPDDSPPFAVKDELKLARLQNKMLLRYYDELAANTRNESLRNTLTNQRQLVAEENVQLHKLEQAPDLLA